MILVYLIPIAIVIGYLRGGRLSAYEARPLRGVVLPCLAFVIEAFLGKLPSACLSLCVTAEYALLALFCGLNIRRRGMKLMSLGVLLNVLVIFSNGFRMPVGEIVHSMPDLQGTVARIQSGELIEYVLATADTRFALLGDVICLPFLPGGLFSVGDFLLGAGVTALLIDVMGTKASRDA